MKKLYFLISSFLMGATALAQVPTSGAKQVQQTLAQHQQMVRESILKDYPVRNIGPVKQGGRIVDLAVDPTDPTHYFVAYASGGLFETKNNGSSFTPVFDGQGTLDLGAVAIAPSNPQVIYVGTGESNSSRSSYAGAGMFRSTDGGKTWQHIGLTATQHTGRIVVHPKNPDIAWVAANGALYSKDDNRGVYKTTDGGKTWKKTLFVNDSTGAFDLVINPNNPDQLWAATWTRLRKAWNFEGNGPGSAIYRSDDGGETWQKSMQGIPSGEFTGRIGLDIAASSPNILYAVMDNQEKEKKEGKKEEEEGLQLKDFVKMPVNDFLELDDMKLNAFLKKQGYPEKYTADVVKKEVKSGKYTPKALTEYFEDANEALFDTKVKGCQVFRSEDFGKTWKQVNAKNLDGLYYTYGYYFAQVRVSPKNPDNLYIMGVPLLVSRDGGQSFQRTDTIGEVHSDHHAMWIDPQNPKHVLLGNDGGLYVSYDAGARWDHINNTSVGQFYSVAVDNDKPYHVYGGLQDNGSAMGSSQNVPNEGHWEDVFGGDGMYCLPDPSHEGVAYSGFQFGNYYRIDKQHHQYTYITPKADIGAPRLRFNWRTPLVQSVHNKEILYIGAQKVYRSLDRGDHWTAISDDLTKNLPQGNVPYSTISEIAESPLQFGLLYVGTDDGKVWVTQDGGADWKDISAGLPDLWVSSICPSPHEQNTVFVTLTGYRQDHFEAYVYKSEDNGEHWTRIGQNLPDEATNVVEQDPEVPGILYVGTDGGTYISMNGGTNWQVLDGIPNVASYDMAIQHRDGELVVGTHGRSVYVVDVKPFRKLAKEGTNNTYWFSKEEDIRYSKKWGEQTYNFSKPYLPSFESLYYAPSDGKVSFNITDKEGKSVWKDEQEVKTGFGTFHWNLKTDGRKADFVKPGDYTLTIRQGSHKASMTLHVKEPKHDQNSIPDPEALEHGEPEGEG